MSDLFNPADGFTADVTAENLADLFGVSRTMVYKYRDQGMPQKSRNMFDLRECVRWMLDRASRPQSATEETTRAALNNAQREKVELELARARGELVQREEVRRVLFEIAQITASQLDALAPRLAPLMPSWSTPAAAQAAITHETMAVRASIAHALRDYVTADVSPSPAAKPKRAKRETA